MKPRYLMLLAPLALAASGCQTWGPTWSEVSGNRYNFSIVNRQPAVIESIDGQSAFPTRPIKIDPGMHKIEIAGVDMRPRAGGGKLTTISLNVEPCKLYYINAQYPNPVEYDYEPVIDYVDTIPGCKVPAG